MAVTFDERGQMWAGEGDRHVLHVISFGTEYVLPPAVQLTVSLLDFYEGSNQRLDLRAQDVTETGFTIRVGTWGDTRIARLRVDWMAIGPVVDPDPWEED